MRRATLAGLLALSAACACSSPQKRTPPVPAYYQGRLAIAAALKAAPHPPRTNDEEFEALRRLGGYMAFDDNKDGALDFDEWIEQEFTPFLIYNVSHDGRLKYDEFRRYYVNLHGGGELDDVAERETRQKFDGMDAGKKGYLTVDDFHDLAFSSFALNDRNHDGKVTEQEIIETSKLPTGHF